MSIWSFTRNQYPSKICQDHLALFEIDFCSTFQRFYKAIYESLDCLELKTSEVRSPLQLYSDSVPLKIILTDLKPIDPQMIIANSPLPIDYLYVRL